MKQFLSFIFVIAFCFGGRSVEANNDNPAWALLKHYQKDRLEKGFQIKDGVLDYDAAAADLDNIYIKEALGYKGIAVHNTFKYEKSIKNTFYRMLSKKLKVVPFRGCGHDICGKFKITDENNLRETLYKYAFRWYMKAYKVCTTGEYGKNVHCLWH